MFHSPTRIHFGVGAVSQVNPVLHDLGARRILLVTDPGVESAGLARKTRENISREIQTQEFVDIPGEPTSSLAEEVVNVARGAAFDAIVGVGGGSVLDMAKLAALAARNAGRVASWMPEVFNTGDFAHPALPSILVPTTAGSGAEVSQHIAVETSDGKRILTSRALRPHTAIIDAALTETMPAEVTAASGLDALAHAIECYLSTRAHRMTEILCLNAATLIYRNLGTAWANPHDLVARGNMSFAALLAGLALDAGTVYGHSMAYVVARRYHLAHGVSTGMALPYAMELNRRAQEAKLVTLAQVLGEDLTGLTSEMAAIRAVQAVHGLVVDLRLPASLRVLGVPKEETPAMSTECLQRYPRTNNPQPMTEDDARLLFANFWAGRLPVIAKVD
jgi:alcohol dehydrogenase class IV